MDTQQTIDSLRTEALARRNTANDENAKALILETAASQLEGTLVTQITAYEEKLKEKDNVIASLQPLPDKPPIDPQP